MSLKKFYSEAFKLLVRIKLVCNLACLYQKITKRFFVYKLFRFWSENWVCILSRFNLDICPHY